MENISCGIVPNKCGVLWYIVVSFLLTVTFSVSSLLAEQVDANKPSPITLANNLSTPYLLAIDQDNVYWTESPWVDSYHKTTVKKVPLSGGTVTTLVTQNGGYGGTGGTGIGVDSTSVSWGVNPGYGGGYI